MIELRIRRAACLAAAALSLSACAQNRVATVAQTSTVTYAASDRDCMARAMYFESHRTGDQGMLAVGTVVMNRLASGKYGSSVCEVVGQKNQFAPGVMTRKMEGAAAETAGRNADAVLSGKRHAGVKTAMHFHTAGLRFRYPNMHYVLVAGGNAFYEKRDGAAAHRDNARTKALALAYARINPAGAAKEIQVASLDAPAARPEIVAAAPAPVAEKSAPQEHALGYAREEASPAAAAVAATRRAAEPHQTARREPQPAPVERATHVAKRVIEPEKAAPALASAVPTPAASPREETDTASPEAAANVAAAFAAFQ